jgi:membrane-associated phospholipid phosphatase
VRRRREKPQVRNRHFSAAAELVRASLTRPYRVTIPMVAFVAIIPLYVFIGAAARGRDVHVPALDLDLAIPLQPAWSLVYGALYAFLIVLPVFVVRDEALLRRTVHAYLTIWITAYICFIAYPTIASRPEQLTGSSFGTWGLRVLYDADTPYNCFPSLHVAHSFVSALACFRVHRTLGAITIACASLVAVSTLFTKQHYVLDVIVGTLMALAAYRLLLHRVPRKRIDDVDVRLAPVFGVIVFIGAGLGLAGFWIVYMTTQGS